MQNLVYNISARSSIVILCGLMLMFSACTDVFEKDISNLTVKLVSPGDSISSQTNVVTFRWEAIDENSSYRLQIAQPNFKDPVRFVLDTLVFATKFDYSLEEGNYQWRVRGENSVDHTEYSTRTLMVDSATNISNQIITLHSPNSGTWTNKALVEFRWNKIDLATAYNIKVKKDSWENGDVVFTDGDITSDRISTTLTEGKFYWAVQGTSEDGATKYSERNVVHIDLTAPASSTPQYPTKDTVLTSTSFPLTFTWNRAANNGSDLKDSLFIYLDSGEPIDTYFTPQLVEMKTYRVDDLPAGNYNWKLRTIDVAGNSSNSYSTIFRFVVQ